MRLPRPAALLLVATLAACDHRDHAGVPSAPVFQPIGEVVRWKRAIVLEENARVINVSPWVQADADGFLVADGQEQQLRLYRADGSLRRHRNRVM